MLDQSSCDGQWHEMTGKSEQLAPELMTEPELVSFLRIPEVSRSQNHHNVVENLKRMHQLPRIHICGKALYPREAIREWIKQKTTYAEQPLAP
jgi:hypothetical protein